MCIAAFTLLIAQADLHRLWQYEIIVEVILLLPILFFDMPLPFSHYD